MEGVVFSFQWETDLMARIQSVASPVLDSVMSAFTMLGEEMLMVAIMAYLILCLDKKMGRDMAAGMIVSLLSGMILKNHFLRRRPYFDNPEIQCLRAPSGKGDIMDIAIQGYSFPSLHSSNAVVMFGTLFYWFRKKWVRALCILFPLIIGFSRIYLGVHYPTDVLAGWLTGLLAFALMTMILKRYSNWLIIFLICTLLSIPGWLISHTSDFFSVFGLMTGMFLAFHFDDKVVRFTNIPNSLRSIIRLICGLAIFIGLSKGLKIPFSKEFLASDSLPAHLVCSARYAISAFALMGLYPMLFKYTDRLLKKAPAATLSV